MLLFVFNSSRCHVKFRGQCCVSSMANASTFNTKKFSFPMKFESYFNHFLLFIETETGELAGGLQRDGVENYNLEN